MYLWLPEVINSEYQLTSVGFWRSVRSVRVIERRSNYLCLWGLSNFAKRISLETFGCIKQPFFHNLLTLLNLQHWIDYQLDFPSIANFFQPPYFPRRVIFFLTQRFTCTPIQNPHPEQLTPYWWALLKKSETAVCGCNPVLLRFYQCRVDVLQSQIFLRSQISLAAMFVITDFCWYSSWSVYDLYPLAFIFVQQSLCSRYLGRHEGTLRDYPNA